MDWDAIARQFLAGQGLTTRTASAPQTTANVRQDPGVPPELSSIPPALLTALLRSLTTSTTAEPDLQPTENPHSDAARRASIVFNLRERPQGTAGRGNFNLQRSLSLNDDDYDLVLRTVKQTCILCHFDMSLAITLQKPDKIVRARSKLKKMFPTLARFSECKVPYWPIDALLLVIMKSSSEMSKRRETKRKDAEAAAQAMEVAADTITQAPLSAPQASDADEDEDESVAGDLTTASIQELDEINVDEVAEYEDEDEDEDEEETEDTPFFSPPAYNDPPAFATPSDTRQTTPAPATHRNAASLAPIASTPAPVPKAAALAPAVKSSRRRPTPISAPATHINVTPSSTVTITSALSAPTTTISAYSATTDTSIHAHAVSAASTPTTFDDAAHLAWFPASLRPSAATTSVPATKGKKRVSSTSTVPASSPPKIVPPSKSTKSKKVSKPVQDSEDDLSMSELDVVVKPGRKGASRAAVSRSKKGSKSVQDSEGELSTSELDTVVKPGRKGVARAAAGTSKKSSKPVQDLEEESSTSRLDAVVKPGRKGAARAAASTSTQPDKPKPARKRNAKSKEPSTSAPTSDGMAATTAVADTTTTKKAAKKRGGR